jgi:tRNA (mo5U34)-methyltransferase
MSLNLDFDLTKEQQEQMARIPRESWFTQVKFSNALSPRHPEADALDLNHELKRELMLPWIKANVKGKKVLDLFCANGAFSFEAALAGAREVVGMEYSPERVQCAQFISSVLSSSVPNGKGPNSKIAAPTFVTGDVYDLKQLFKEPFDVVMCLGGLYHIPDPPYVLTLIRALTRERLIVQTSSILQKSGNWAQFVVRKDLTSRGLTSVVGGRGAWFLTATCFENMLRHAGFTVRESKRPPYLKRRRFPWYCAVADPN